jgi:hypothetical protein
MAKRPYSRRTEKQLIEDLERRIEAARRRLSWKEASQVPSIKLSVSALKALDRALEETSPRSDKELHQALTAARTALHEVLQERGLPAPRRRSRSRSEQGKTRG